MSKRLSLAEFKGSYALVTGATEGLGLAFAKALAAKGLNLVLIARTELRLLTVAAELEDGFKIRVLPLAADLSRVEAPGRIKEILTKREIRIRLLVNNAATLHLGEFDAMVLADTHKMLQLNITAMISLCSLLMDDLQSHGQSAVINVSSAAALQPVPFMAVYAATKAFVQNFSQALQYEVKARGVHIQTLVPGAIDTSANVRIGLDVRAMKNLKSPAEVVAMSLAKLESQRIVVHAAKGLWLQRLFVAAFPAAFVLKTVAKFFQPYLRRKPGADPVIRLTSEDEPHV